MYCSMHSSILHTMSVDLNDYLGNNFAVGLNLQKLHSNDDGSDPMAGLSTRMGDLISFRIEGLNAAAGSPDSMFLSLSYSGLLVIEESGCTVYD